MDQQTDMQLLREWIDHRDRDAIGELIRRHINFVLSTARRQVGNDAHLAEDVTQAVFILLLQKAHHIKSEAAMAGWLFNTTRFAASNARRMIRRREYYERQAAASSVERNEVGHDDDHAQLLNEAIARLPRSDRECVVMSYLQQKSHRQVAEVLGVSEDAARMRVSRAVRRMRDFFIARGITSASEATLGVLSLAGKSSTASAALIESTLNVATLSQSTAHACPSITIAKGITKMIFATKLKIAAAASIALFFGGIVTAQVVQHILAPVAVVVTGEIQNPQAKDSSTVSLSDGVTVNFAGITAYPETKDSWRSIDGKPIARPMRQTIAQSTHTFSEPAFEAVVKVHCSEDAEVRITSRNVTGSLGSWDDSSADRQLMSAFVPAHDGKPVELEIAIADGQWKTLFKLDKAAWQKEPWSSIRAIGTEKGGITFSPAVDKGGNASFYVSVEDIEGQWRVVANDVNGLPHITMPKDQNGTGKMTMAECAFDIPALMIASLEIQSREINKRVVLKNMTLDPNKPTVPEIVVEDGK